MANVKIRIERSNEENDAIESSAKKKEKEKMAAVSLVAHQAIANGKKILGYSVSNIGNFTGDYTKTEGIQFAMGLVGDAASVGVALSTGIVGATVAIAGLTISKSLEAVSYFQDQKHKEIESEYLRARSGNTLTNGSRGTEN